jgi:2-amino-4-hydroxy-6-hydroxymethyldihydropteridine diphosphokinase
VTEAFVALGSNIDPEAHLLKAAHLLRGQFANTRFSACFRNPAFGFVGADFVNAVAGFETALSVETLIAALREIETQCGRGPADPRWGPRAIDLDLLLYGQLVDSSPDYTLPRPDLSRRAYMLGPLAQLAPQLRYPPDGPSIAELWGRFPQAPAGLTRIELDLGSA